MDARVKRWVEYLYEPVDAASLAIVRIALGIVVAWDAERYLSFGWVSEYYIQPKWHFTYLYFDWVKPWPGDWMYVHFAVLFAFGVLVAVGLFYRFSIVVVFLAYTYVFLLEKSVYMNHYYLIGLICFLMIWMQPHRAFSLDRYRHPEWPTTVPRWNVVLLRTQLFIVYFYGAIAKLNPDWLAGEPMYSEIVRHGEDVPKIASRFPPALLAYGIAYGGIMFDASVPILLSLRRTRAIGFTMAALFHFLNHIFLSIGLFSYLMTAAITVFFDPDWPRRLWRRAGFASRISPAPPAVAPLAVPSSRRRWVALAFIHLYVLAQLLVPLRHWLYPGQVIWTEEGHRFSWFMKLRRKAGTMTITATDPATGRRWEIDPTHDLGDRQLKKLYTFPDMLLQYAHYKRDELRAQGIADPIITVDWRCSLNGAPPFPLVDPTVNLATQPETIWPAPWILRTRNNG